MHFASTVHDQCENPTSAIPWSVILAQGPCMDMSTLPNVSEICWFAADYSQFIDGIMFRNQGFLLAHKNMLQGSALGTHCIRFSVQWGFFWAMQFFQHWDHLFGTQPCEDTACFIPSCNADGPLIPLQAMSYVEALGWFRQWFCIPWRKPSLCADIDPCHIQFTAWRLHCCRGVHNLGTQGWSQTGWDDFKDTTNLPNPVSVCTPGVMSEDNLNFTNAWLTRWNKVGDPLRHSTGAAKLHARNPMWK